MNCECRLAEHSRSRQNANRLYIKGIGINTFHGKDVTIP
jgi:hypothetical protein